MTVMGDALMDGLSDAGSTPARSTSKTFFVQWRQPIRRYHKTYELRQVNGKNKKCYAEGSPIAWHFSFQNSKYEFFNIRRTC